MRRDWKFLGCALALAVLSGFFKTSWAAGDESRQVREECPGAKNGTDICDDQLPLPFATSEKTPPPAPGCDATAWEKGFRESLAGQRFLIGMSPKKMPISAERKGCQAYRSGKERDQALLQCCSLGFFAGMHILSEKISEAKESDSSRIKECVASFEVGQEMAQTLCDGSSACLPSPEDRYLGCYTLGFASSYQGCAASEAEQLKGYLKKYGIAISGKRDRKSLPTMPAGLDQLQPPHPSEIAK